ncbi:hypothetical protein [Hyalangium rubrum]|uniref:Uncharacterized protein n=1 Tax=Hyalangium rubrum TaxID=3103134 RepID=A0ABU5HAL6_9BACT|nr:hypothetical protein [Hyalangium sp. s54d21]MDY7230296.1 hypothetical protein [Hyalangium sp. s54d21]
MSEESKQPQEAASQPSAPPPQAAPAQAPSEEEAITPEQAKEFFLSVLDYGQEEADAKAGILEELMDLILPEASAIARPIRAPSPEDAKAVEKLEKQFGVAVREQAAAWLNEPAIRLAGASRMLEPRTGGATESGGVLRRELFMLGDGRLVTVETVNTWFMEGEKRVSGDTLVGAREVSAAEVLRLFDFVAVLKALLETLFDGASALKNRNEQALAIVERSGRFFTIIAQVAVGMKENADRLRRAGDTPA